MMLRDVTYLGYRWLAGDVIKETKPVITLYYESSWEYAYLHYSADGSEYVYFELVSTCLGFIKRNGLINVVHFYRWTTLPGVCMLNGIFVNNMPLKV